MIYLLTGNKTERKAFIQELSRENEISPDQIQHLYFEDFNDLDFENTIPVNTGLFDDVEFFVIHDCVRDLNIKDILKNYSETEHVLVFSEDSALKKDLAIFEKSNATIKQFNSEQKIEKDKYNTFALAYLLGARDRKNLWMAYRDAVTHVSIEEIHGILFWQLKNLALVLSHDINPGMNPYVFKKNQSFAKNYTLDEIKKLSIEMTKMIHNRDTYRTLEIDLENFILNL